MPGGLPWTAEQVAYATTCPIDNVRVTWPVLYQMAKKRGFDSPRNLVGLLGTFAKETASTMLPVREAFWLSEAWRKTNLTRYYPYYGRGFIQTTWLSNYQRVTAITGVDVVADPDKLLEPEIAAEAAAIYWDDHGLRDVSDRADWAEVRKRVYGGADPDGAARIARVASTLGVA